MRTEIKTYGTVCDSCNIELHDDNIRSNCGKFQEPYLKHGDIDLCYSCAGKIFYREIVEKVPEEKLNEWIKSLKKAEGSNPISPDITIDLESLKYGFGKTNESEKQSLNDLDSAKSREELTLSSLEDIHKLKIPTKSNSSMTFLSDL